MKPFKVLIADDNPFFRKVIGELLEAESFDVWMVNDGLDALKVAKHLNPDLIITDEIMPRVTGMELCNRVRSPMELNLSPFTIVMTGRPESTNPFHATEFGVDLYLGKKELVSLIDRRLLRPECLVNHFQEVLQSIAWKGNSLQEGADGSTPLCA